MKPLVSPHAALLAVLTLATLVAGCQSARRTQKPTALPPSFSPTTVADLPPLDAALLQRPNYEYRLGPGDTVEIEALGDVNTQSTAVVGPDGKIYFYMLPGIDVWGLTLPEVREKVNQGLKQLIREEQPVSISLKSTGSQRIWMLGRVGKPGAYAMAGPMTLLEAISEAGGPTSTGTLATFGTAGLSVGSSRNASDDAADLSRAFVLREGRMLRVDFHKLLREGDLSQNIYLRPDDFVYMPPATLGNVHVLGAVTTPRAVDYTGQLTLMQAIAQAGGPFRRYAHLSQVAIIRGSLTQPQVAVVDFTAIAAGQASDVLLQPQDIVYVPDSPHRILTRYVDMVLDTFVRTVGVNEGARAVSGEAQLGVTVPLITR